MYSIVIPCYKSSHTIRAVVEETAAAMERRGKTPFRFVLVDDCSPDGGETARELKALAEDHDYVTAVCLAHNGGQHNALICGLNYADGDVIIFMDDDGQHDPENVLNIYKALTTADENNQQPDIVLGSRFLKDSEAYKSSLIKNIGYILFRALIKILTGKKISDPTTGLQGLSRRTFCYYAGFDHFDPDYPDANMILQMIMLGYNVKEIPAKMHKRTKGKSMHSGIKPVVYVIRMCYSIFAVWIRIKILKTDKKVNINDSLAS